MTSLTAATGTYEPGDELRYASVWQFVRQSASRVVVVGTSKDPNPKLTVLLIPPGSSTPKFAVKVPMTDPAADAVDWEGRLLVELHRQAPRFVLSTIPKVVDVVDALGRRAIVTTALRGAPMTTQYLRWRHTARSAAVRRDWDAVERWLTKFQAETARQPAQLDMDAGVISRLAARFAGDPRLQSDLEHLRTVYAVLGRSSTPRTPVHGDFWSGNILISGADVSGVIDWEAGAAAGEPVRDVVRFANMYALFLDRHARPGRKVPGHGGLRAGRWGSGLVYAIDGAGWFPDLYRQFLRRGLARLGAVPDSWREAALAGIAEVAALTDHDDFALLHLRLFRQLVQRKAWSPARHRIRGEWWGGGPR